MTETDHHYQTTPKLLILVRPISRAIRDSAHVSKTLKDCCKYTNYILEGKYKDHVDMREQTGLDYTNLRIKITHHKHKNDIDIVVASLLLDILGTLKITYNSMEEIQAQAQYLVNQMYGILEMMVMREEFPNKTIKTTHNEITIADLQKNPFFV